jgi:glucose/mannose-6-phosphate isomerase
MMKELIQAFPANLAEALEIAKRHTFKKPTVEIKNIVICGMGGSGIGGKIVSQWLEEDLTVPVTLCQDYHLPSFVNQHTLVLASSYSGNTEETLMSVETAHQKGAFIIGVTSGGQMETFCKVNNHDVVVVPGGNPPRTALAYSLVQLVNIFANLGMSSAQHIQSLENARRLIVKDEKEIQALAKEMATVIGPRIPVFYSVARYEGVSVRAKQQFNENAKKLCWMHVIPEMNHNELVGWGGGSNDYTAVFFDSGDIIERNRRRLEISLDRVRSKTNSVYVLKTMGSNVIERSIYLINIIDWASLYHADMNNVDSIEIEIIDYLKDQLSKL